MDMSKYIGEASAYDKELMFERKGPFRNGHWEVDQ